MEDKTITKKWRWMMAYCKKRNETPANSFFWDGANKAYDEFKTELKINISIMSNSEAEKALKTIDEKEIPLSTLG